MAVLPPPPLHQQIILLTPHHSRRVSPPLCFQLYRSLAPTCTALLSTSDYLSHFASSQECRPLYANPVVLSVPRTHRRNKAHRNRNNCLQKNKKTISQTFLFESSSMDISQHLWEQYWWLVLKLRHVGAFSVFKLCQKIFSLLCVYSHLSFELLLQAVLLSLSLSLIYFFFQLNFSEFLQITKSHTSSAAPGRSKHIMHCSSFRSVTSFPIFDVVFTTVSHNLHSPFESEVWRKDYRREVTDKGTLKVFFVNSNLSPALIGPLTTAVRVINKTIELERWGLVLPTTDRTLQLLCESWSRKWIVISFYGHKRLS